MQKPQEKHEQRLAASEIAQSSRAKAALRTAAPANGSRPSDQVDAVLQGSPRLHHGAESYRAQAKRRHVKRASASQKSEMMDISIIIPVEDFHDVDELMETVMTRRAGPQGAQTMLKEPMIAQEEEEGVTSTKTNR